MKCLMCSYFCTESRIKNRYRPTVAEMLLKSIEALGFDGYCEELDVLIGEECCCSLYERKVED